MESNIKQNSDYKLFKDLAARGFKFHALYIVE
jgi:hypothetical protein